MIRDQQRFISDLEIERARATELESQLLKQKSLAKKSESLYSALQVKFEEKRIEHLDLTQTCKALEIDLKTLNELYEERCIQMENFELKVKNFEERQKQALTATKDTHRQTVIQTSRTDNFLDEKDQIELRVQKILAQERSETRLFKQNLEQEVKSLESKLIDITLENENLLKQISQCQ